MLTYIVKKLEGKEGLTGIVIVAGSIFLLVLAYQRFLTVKELRQRIKIQEHEIQEKGIE